MKKLLLSTLLFGAGSVAFAQNAQRTADLELHFAHPTDGQEIVGLQTIIKLDIENHGPDRLWAGDTMVINFPGSSTYMRVLQQDLNVGERVKIFDEMLSAPQFANYTLSAYLVEDLSKVMSQGQYLQPGWVDPDSVNNIKTIQFSNVQEPSSVDDHKLYNISLFPNPTAGMLYIDLGSVKAKQTELSIFDISGRQVHQQKLSLQNSTAAISVAHLPKGSYNIVLQSSGQILYKNFIKL
jgi:hypothetical protein